LKTITRADDRLGNVHPGEVLREEFLIGGEVPIIEVVEGAGVDRERLEALLDERTTVDAETDLRLARYFGVSEGFFLRLQNAFDLEEARRTSGGALDRIVPRAA